MPFMAVFSVYPPAALLPLWAQTRRSKLGECSSTTLLKRARQHQVRASPGALGPALQRSFFEPFRGTFLPSIDAPPASFTGLAEASFHQACSVVSRGHFDGCSSVENGEC